MVLKSRVCWCYIIDVIVFDIFLMVVYLLLYRGICAYLLEHEEAIFGYGNGDILFVVFIYSFFPILLFMIWWNYILFAIYHKVSWKYLNGTLGEHLTGIQTVLVDGSNVRKYLICYYFVKIIFFPITLFLLWIQSKEDVWWLAKVCGVIIEKRKS